MLESLSPDLRLLLLASFSLATIVAIAQGLASRKSSDWNAYDHLFAVLGSVGALTMLLPAHAVVFYVQMPFFAAASAWFLVGLCRAVTHLREGRGLSHRASFQAYSFAMMVAMLWMAYRCLTAHVSEAVPIADVVATSHHSTALENSSDTLSAALALCIAIAGTGAFHFILYTSDIIASRQKVRWIALGVHLMEVAGSIVMVIAMAV